MEKEINKIEQKVMQEIHTGKIKPKSKYIFLAEKFGLNSILVFTFFVAVLFLSLFFYYLRATDNIWYLSFGSRGLFAFLQSFPYLLVIVIVISIFFAGYVLKKTNFLYKKPFIYTALILFGVILIVGIVLTFVGVAEKIEQRTFGRPGAGMFLRPFLGPGLDDRGGGIAGRIIQVDTDFIIIQTPGGLIKIDINKIDEEIRTRLVPGQFIIAIGEREGKVFHLEDVRVLDEQMMPMIGRGIHRKFGSFDTAVQNCMHDCRVERLDFEKCGERCFK